MNGLSIRNTAGLGRRRKLLRRFVPSWANRLRPTLIPDLFSSTLNNRHSNKTEEALGRLMVRSPRFALIVALALVTGAAPSHSQQESGSSSQSQNPPLTTPQEQAQRSVSAKPGAKKTKKVWTNENLSDAGGTISVVGDTRNAPKGPARTDQRSSSGNAVDPRVISGLRQQLEKLQAQLADVDRQLADLKDFSKGSSKGSGGIQ